ncbi:MAG: lipopolysaccharide heptosyltransferase I [Alphaproteobacteria bacterium]|nr:lipopolysaccharide heptosyltransferase I [Alphaproteobacteria bacterium]
MRVLVVKTSSIGDVIHTLPALTDARRATPDIAFDWVVEDELAPIPRWHPAVDRVITVAYRRWRYRPLQGILGGALAGFRSRLRERRYDAVIDAQALYKSGVITAMADGPKHGYDLASCREKLAPLAYDRRYRVPREGHAIERTRRLFAMALGYPVPQGVPDYGLDPSRLPATDLPQPFVLLLHGTKWRTKLWSPERWRELGRIAAGDGHAVCLPWQTQGERRRAEAVAGAVPGARVLPPADLDHVAGVLARAAGVIAVDTGLAHLAAALSVPTVALYGPTGPGRTGTLGARQVHAVATKPCAPCRNKICNYTGNAHAPSPCLDALAPESVWRRLREAMRGTG